MKLLENLTQKNISFKAFAVTLQDLGYPVTEEAVRLWATGERIPRKNVMGGIVIATDGATQPNDFYDLPTKPETEAVAS